MPLFRRWPTTRPPGNRLARSWRWPYFILSALILIFILAYSWLAVTRHSRLNSTGFDLAINEQILWNTLNGRFFATSLEVDNSFADHFRPFLLAVLPAYALFQTPETLLVLQTIVLASAAIPLYLLARYKLENEIIALALAAAYLLYPAVGFTARFDFHIEVFAIPAFIASVYAMERGRWTIASLFLIIPLLCKENMGLVVAIVGLYALIRHRRYKWGVAWIFIGLFSFWVTSFWLIPRIRGEELDALDRYAWLGQSPAEILITLFTDPAIVWQQLIAPDRLRYLMQLFLPLGFVSLLGLPALLLVVPGLAMNLLAQHFCQPTIYCHYTVPVTPFIFIAAIFGLSRLKSKLAPDAGWLAVAILLVLLSAFSFWLDNPFGETLALPSALKEIDNADVVAMALASVPDDASVVTTNDYAPHLARREELYIIGVPSQRSAPTDPDVVFLNLYDQQYIVCDQYRDYVSQLDLRSYGLTFRTGGLVVAQRGAGSNEQFQDFVLNWNNCAG